MLFQPLKPMLLTMRPDAFDDPAYIYEPKWDGWRVLVHKDGDRIEAYTRQGNRVTAKFPELLSLGGQIRSKTAILDCEGVCIRDGRSVFDDFAYRGRLTNERKISVALSTHPVTFVAFDILYADGDCTGYKLMDRKHILSDIVTPGDHLTPTMFVEGEGKKLKSITEQKNWEGIVCKRKDSTYHFDTRSIEWLKVKNWKTIDAVILGYRREPQFALIVGLHFPTIQNKPVAAVEFGFTPEEKIAFLRIAQQLHTVKDRHAQWIEPRLCCKVQYLERTERHQLRITSFRGFLFDKDPDDCVWVS